MYFDCEPKPGLYDLVHYHECARPRQGSHCVPFWTRLIDLRRPPEELLGAMSRENRRLIRKADEAQDFTHTYLSDPDAASLREFIDCQRRFCDLKGLKQRPDDLWQMLEGGLLHLSFTLRRDDSPIAWRAYLHAGSRVRAMRWGSPRLEASTTAERQSIGKATRHGVWKDILSAREQGAVLFDLGGWYHGSDNKQLLSINLYKKEFGGEVVEEFNCIEGRSWRGRMALALYNARRALRRNRWFEHASTMLRSNFEVGE